MSLAPVGDGLAPLGERLLLRYPFPASADAPSEARRRTTEVLSGSRHLDVVLVLISELVTNAVLHTAADAELRVSCRETNGAIQPAADGSVIRVEVEDRRRSSPRSPETPGAHGGYGLRIVAAMADDWGCTPLADGKVVWFEIGARIP